MNRLGKITVSILSLFLIMALSCFVACMPSDKNVKEEIERMNQSMPQDIGDGMSLRKIDFNSNGFVYIVECMEDGPSINLIKEHQAEIKETMLANLKRLAATENDTKALLDYCKKADKTLSYQFIDKKSGEEITITASPSEM